MSEAATRIRAFIDEFRARRTDETISSLVTVFADDCRLPLHASDIEAVLAEHDAMKQALAEEELLWMDNGVLCWVASGEPIA